MDSETLDVRLFELGDLHPLSINTTPDRYREYEKITWEIQRRRKEGEEGLENPAVRQLKMYAATFAQCFYFGFIWGAPIAAMLYFLIKNSS